MDAKHLKGTLLPPGVTLDRGWIVLHVPVHVTVDNVNRAVHAMLSARCLRQVLAGPEQQAALSKLGYDPFGWFHTAYDRMSGTARVSATEELYEIQPRVELPWLVEGLGRIVASFDTQAMGHRA